MTEFFEVTDRDGTARLGTLRLDTPLETPGVVGDRIDDVPDAWADATDVNPADDAVVTILPERGFPPGTPDAVVDAFGPEPVDTTVPVGLPISARNAADLGADVYALTSVQGVIGHGTAFVDTITTVRRSIPADTALYLSGAATPGNVALLAYAGVDLVDDTRARLAGSRGYYLLPTGRTHLDDLEELPCPCRVCTESRDTFDRSACIEHNVARLTAELATVREHIRRGTLREFVSARSRHHAWVTAAFRSFDDGSYVREHAPLFRGSQLSATTDDALRRPEIRRYADRIRNRYRDRFRTPLVLLPCSASKPYSESQSHRQFRDAISHRAHRLAISSPLGIVPQELECTYPAQHYDIPVTGHWSASEREFITRQLRAYLASTDYPRVLAHVVDGPYREVVAAAAAAADVSIEYTATDHPTTDESLATLEATLDGELAYSKRTRQHHTVRAIADYQFGPQAGDTLFPEIEVEAPYPKHRVRDPEGAHLATMVPNYGLLALTVAGARQWVDSDVPTRVVEIDSFVPHGDVLAPGIVSADESIRTGEEVVVRGPEAFGIGRATMPGRDMETSSRGIAVDMRHVEEL